MNGRTGLDYPAVQSTLGLYLPRWQRDQPELFGDLELADLMESVQIIETAMLTVDSERREQERQKKGQGNQ